MIIVGLVCIFSVLQKELSVSALQWQLDDLNCTHSKLKETSSLIATALDKLGNRQPQKFADLSAPTCAPSGVSKSYENGNTQLVTSHVMNIL